MRDSNGNGQRVSRIFMVMTLAAIGCGLIGAKANAAVVARSKAQSPIVAKCKADLAKRLKLPIQDINAIEVKPTTWPDAAMGMPESGKMYAQVLTPGLKIIIEAQSTRYLYVTSRTAFKYGGPISTWSYSILYSNAVHNEPNLNGNLYQCSLVGTNPVLLVSGVSDFYPQAKGLVICKRRTSRSGHDLFYVKADGKKKEKPLYSAFDLGDAAMNDAQTEWAGFVRPMVGGPWGIVVAGIGPKGAHARTLALPEGVQSGRIAWSGENVMILAKKGEGQICFETSPKAATPEWKAVGVNTFPGLADYVLNKSQTLEITQITENAKPTVEIARVWFTGDRDVTAKIVALTMRGYDLLGGYVFVWGDKGSAQAAYTVNLSTGEVIPSFHGACRDIKPFLYPPLRAPITAGKLK